MTIKLNWYTTETGLTARLGIGKHQKTFRIERRPHAYWKRNGEVWELFFENKRIYGLESVYIAPDLFGKLTSEEQDENVRRKRAAKQSLKDVANAIANGNQASVYQEVLYSLPQRDKFGTKQAFIYAMKEVFRLTHLPIMTVTEKDNTKQWSTDSEFIRSFPQRHREQQRRTHVASPIAAQEVNVPVKTEALTAKPVKALKYKGPAPANRNKETLIPASIGTKKKCPVLIEGTKFKHLYKWAEKTRDWYQARGYHAGILFLIHTLMHSLPTCKQALAAGRKLSLIYREEYAAVNAQFAAMVSKEPTEVKKEVPEKQPKLPRSKEKDKWGYRVSTRAAAVNAVLSKVPMSKEKITVLAKAQGDIGSHLSTLIKQKLVVRTEEGLYRLRKKKKVPKHGSKKSGS